MPTPKSDQLVAEKTVLPKPYAIKKMGTSGLRMTQEEYNRPGFYEQFIEGIAQHFEGLPESAKIAGNRTIVLGGDPRKGNPERIRVAAEILAAHGFKVLVANDGLASTPAMSHAIRHTKSMGGIILTASHNPWTDVGVKINIETGAPALPDTVDPVFDLQNKVTSYSKINYDAALEAGLIEGFDSVKLYADLLDQIFDFAGMQTLQDAFAAKHGHKPRLALDGMAGAAGPYAVEVFGQRLGLSNAKFLRCVPDQFLGGHDEHGHPLHPEPDFSYVPDLIELNASGEFELVAAWDSDVDRRLDGGSGFWLESADEFALFAKYGDLIGIERLFANPDGNGGEIFFCRSTVTAHAIDLMKGMLERKYAPNKYKVNIVETPTGFKWIAELGNWGAEESNGVGNPYLREKDGVFATAFLHKILLVTGKTPKQLMEEIWTETGRVYFTRGEVSGSDAADQPKLTAILNNASSLVGQSFAGLTLEGAEHWDYVHPVTGEVAAKGEAWVLKFSDGNVIKARFSGTGSGGYTLRVYASKFDMRFNLPKSPITQPMKQAFDALLASQGFTGQSQKWTDAKQPDPYKG